MAHLRSRGGKAISGGAQVDGGREGSPAQAPTRKVEVRVKEEPEPERSVLLLPPGRAGKGNNAGETAGKAVVGVPDVWSRRSVTFTTMTEGHKALQDEALLGPFFDRWEETTRALEVTCAGVNTDLCNDVIASRKITVLVYGEAGAGKSTLVKALTPDADILTVSATGIGTVVETEVCLPCGLRLVDTPGFRVPLPLRSSATSSSSVPTPGAAHLAEGGRFSLAWLREVLAWRAMLGSLHGRLASQDARLRPFALIYCHRVGARILRERVVELLRIPHMKLVPVFTVLTDVTNADDDDLVRIRTEWSSLLQEVGRNAKGAVVHLVEVNSFAKTVRGHTHRQTGVKELMAMLLNSLDPLDALTFARMPGIFTPSRKRKRTEATTEAT